jgi:hypothetical protein
LAATAVLHFLLGLKMDDLLYVGSGQCVAVYVHNSNRFKRCNFRLIRVVSIVASVQLTEFSICR